MIQTFKGHFISVLAGVADGFPINQWDELLPQTILTLNLLRQSNVAPNISAFAYHHGSFDYNRMPIAPMGCAVQFHIKLGRRKTFGEHSEDGFYLKTSEEHYRIQDTCDICQNDTSQTSRRHSVLQAQIYHSTYNHTSKCDRQCIQQIAASHPRTPTPTLQR